MSWFSRKVDVEMIDANTGKVIIRSKVPPDDLPESFLFDTTLTIGDKQYSVVAADPPLREAYAKTKRLVLRVVRVEIGSVDPRELLFSLPTINDALPLDEGAADGSELELHEDDWRQFELVHEQHREAIDLEIEAIRDVWQNARKEVGFTRVHIRGAIVAPLPPNLVRLAGDSRPIRFRGHGERVANGFATPAFYGIREDGYALVLGVRDAPPAIDEIRAIAEQHGLLLVDWCACRVASPRDAEFAAMLTRGA